MISGSEPVFVDLLRRLGKDAQPGELDSSQSIPGLHKRLQIRALVLKAEFWFSLCRDWLYEIMKNIDNNNKIMEGGREKTECVPSLT
jgi:hypothetical protein